MVVLCSRGENCESNHWRGTSEECHKRLTSGNLRKPGHEVANITDHNLLMSLLSTHDLIQPFNKRLLLPCCLLFFYPKYVLLRLLKVLFIKRTLNFLSVIISYLICHWNVHLNFRNFENLFRSSLSVSFIKCFLFLCYSNMIANRKFLVSRSYHPILGINFSTLYFRFHYDLLPSVSFLLMNELHYCTDLQVSTSPNFLALLAEKYLNNFSLIGEIESINHARFFFDFCRIELN